MFCLIKGRIISVKIGLFLQEITSRTKFPSSNVLLPTFLTGGKWDFQVANLLLAIANFKPCICNRIFDDNFRMIFLISF